MELLGKKLENLVKNGTLKWTHLNRANNGKIYPVRWSRILHGDEDIKIVNKLLQSRGKCND